MGFFGFALLTAVTPNQNFKNHLTEVLLPNTQRIVLAEAIRVYRSETKLLADQKPQDQMNLDDILQSIQVHAMAPTATLYQFEIKEVLRGEVAVGSTMIVSIEESELTYPCQLTLDYTGHSQDEFWQGSEGRAMMGNHREPHIHTTCFELGQSYLLLDQRLFQSRAFELIQSEDDQWYRFIKSEVGSQGD